MGEVQPLANFVSKKISKIRWRPTSKHIVQKPTIFATGSWDDNENELSVWHIDEVAHNVSSYDVSEDVHVDDEPVLLRTVPHKGDVTDLLFLDQDNIVSTSSSGEVFVFKYDQRQQAVRLQHNFGKVHRFGADLAHSCPCTAVASRGDERIVTVGEDGRVVVLALETLRSCYDTIFCIDGADSCALNAVCFLTQSEVAAVNSIGQFKVWDVRQRSDDPVHVLVAAGDRVPLHCMDRHPTQTHIVATGGQDGKLCLWDMRQEKYPVTLLTVHSTNMWEVRFHPSHPTHLFTCSNDGSVWHWDSSDVAAMSTPGALLGSSSTLSRGSSTSMQTSASVTDAGAAPAASSSWLIGDAAKRHLVAKQLLNGNFSVNSIDVAGNCLLCGTDAEQICVIKNLAIC